MAPPKKASAPRGTSKLGMRLIEALVPRYFPSLAALQLAAQGPAYSTLNNWKHGKAMPEWESVEAMARLVDKDPLELLAPRSGDLTALRNHPDFRRALAKAKVRFPKRVPDRAYERAADTHTAQWPEHIDELFLFNLAQFWWTNAPDADVMVVEEEEMRSEMAAIDSGRTR